MMQQELIEAEAWGDPVDVRAYLNDDPSFGSTYATAYTSIDDRADGKLWPIYRVEQDLARIRMVARRLSSVTGTSTGVVDALANYTLGNGFEFKASGADQSLVASIQAAIDELLNRWQFIGGLDRELHDRSREDGEALVAIERGADGWPCPLIIEPDCLTEPADSRSMEDYCRDCCGPQSWSFGVRTSARNTAEVLGYHVAFDAGGADWEYYPEARLQHVKRNATRAAKRGVSDWYPVAGDVVREAKLRRNTMQGATLQSAIAWILQSPTGTTAAQSGSVGSGGSVGTYSRSVGNNGPQTYQRKDYPAGTVLTPSAGLEYHPGPMGAERNAGFLEVAQYALRSIGVRWNMPEAMVSGDASNANYASSLVAEAPFVKAREADQAFYSEHFKRLLWKALRFMWELGLLQIPCGFDQLKALIDIKVDCPKVASRDPQEQAATAAAYVAMGAMSVRTASVEAGYDYDQEVSNGAAKAAPPPMPGVPGDPSQNVNHGTQNPDPSMMLPESHCDGPDMQQAVAIALESVATESEARAVLSQLMEFDESKINRQPGGSDKGGEFAPKGGGAKATAIRDAAKAIPFSSEIVLGEEISSRDYDQIESRLDADNRREMEDYVEGQIDDAADREMEGYDPSDDIDNEQVSTDAKWSIDDIRDKAREAAGDWDTLKGDVVNWWDENSSEEGHGVEGIDSLKKKIEDKYDTDDEAVQKFMDDLDGMRREATTDINIARYDAKDAVVKAKREEVRNEISDAEYKRDWIQSYVENNPEVLQAGRKVNQWGKAHDGDDAFAFDIASGQGFDVRVYDAKIGGVATRSLQFQDASGSFAVTGDVGPRGAAEVMRTVTHATVAYTLKNEPQTLHFSAAEPSRQKLYDRLVRSSAEANPDYAAVAISTADKPKNYFLVKRDHMDEFKKKMAETGVDVSAATLVEATRPKMEILKPESNPDWFTEAGWSEFKGSDKAKNNG